MAQPDLSQIQEQLEARRALKRIVTNQAEVLGQLLDGVHLVLSNLEQEERDLESKLTAARRNGMDLISTNGGTRD